MNWQLRLTVNIRCSRANVCVQLGIPTANIPIEGLSVGGNEQLESGVYFGWAGLDFRAAGTQLQSNDDDGWEGHGKVHPMVMSVGWNPYYKNTVRSVVCTQSNPMHAPGIFPLTEKIIVS